MSIQYEIPHSSLFQPTNNIFTARFNIPTPGKYDFNQAVNKNVEIMELETGSVYLIERISLAGSISQESYLESIEIMPILRLKLQRSGEIVYKRDIPLVNYSDNTDIVTWIYSHKAREKLTADVYGLLIQIPDTVEQTEIKLNINLSCYQIRDSQFTNRFFGATGTRTGEQVSGRR